MAGGEPASMRSGPCPVCGLAILEPVFCDGALICRGCAEVCAICGGVCVVGDEACLVCAAVAAVAS